MAPVKHHGPKYQARSPDVWNGDKLADILGELTAELDGLRGLGVYGGAY